ncbi:hypothetical protein PENSTE_c011G01423 [Penicillium steckii]|uniref:Myb-like domain-containing protein n=1 Tax=Penicillium steckii TaxID=303698 RepID=A0A1V6T5U3_9EURO|nr:hypothetical protein PENSTE_c011G01423 [Penicillium steckii]
MKSFSSSAINKSGKKFAPKAPARRGAPAPAAPARRPSAVQQSQVQSAQNVQQERHVRGSVGSIAPSPVASVEPEPPAIPESTPPVTAAQSQEHPPIIPQPATAIPIPRPKRRGSISTPATQEPTRVPSPIHDVPPSPRTSAIEPPTEPEIFPSIEQDVELSAAPGVSVPSTQHADDAVAPNDITSPRPSVLQTSASVAAPRPSFMPVEYQPAKRAKKTSEITKSRQKSQSRVSVSAASTGDATSETPGGSLAPSTPEPSQASKTTKKRKQSKAGASDADGTDKTKRTRRIKREPTPEGAETVEILPNVMKMSELCKDLKTGKKSKREIELRRLEQIELEEKQKAQEEGSATGTPKKNKTPDVSKKDENRPPEAKGPSGPVMRIVNGEIVLDTASLEVDRHADAAREAGDLEDVVENQLTRKINQASYGKRSKTESWDEEMTDLFYRGLRMFGTDFMIISNMFPGRSRRQIKLKFNNEERRDPQRIKDTLMGPREIVDIETYTAMTNQTYDDPKVIQQELDEEKRVIEEQHEKEKQLHEEMMRNPNGGAEEDTKGDKGKGSGKGKSRNSKKQAKNLGGGGTEEVLGSIDEIPAF